MTADIPRAKPPLTAWGMLMVIFGFLILAPCGLCTTGVLLVNLANLFDPNSRQEAIFFGGLGLVVGGIPTALGGLLLFLGLRLRKRI